MRYNKLQKSGNDFAFLVHPREITDVYRKYPFAKILPERVVLFLLSFYWPVVLSEVTGLCSQKDGQPIRGWIIAVPLTARQMIEDRWLAKKKIIQATKLARRLGASLIGLGALTASLSRGGLDLIEQEVGVYVTTGHAYTAHTVTANLFKLVSLFKVDKREAVVAIVGAAGSVGSASAELIAAEGYKRLLLIDIDRKGDFLVKLVEKLKRLYPDIQLETSHKISFLRTADFVITATNAPEAVVSAEDLKRGAVIIDDAQPSDVLPEVLDEEDVLVIEGGLVHTPGIETHFNFGLKDRFDNYCCLAEVMILAAHGIKGYYSIGRGVAPRLVKEVSRWGEKLNFRLAEFQNFKEVIPEAKLNRIKDIIASRP